MFCPTYKATHETCSQLAYVNRWLTSEDRDQKDKEKGGWQVLKCNLGTHDIMVTLCNLHLSQQKKNTHQLYSVQCSVPVEQCSCASCMLYKFPCPRTPDSNEQVIIRLQQSLMTCYIHTVPVPTDHTMLCIHSCVSLIGTGSTLHPRTSRMLGKACQLWGGSWVQCQTAKEQRKNKESRFTFSPVYQPDCRGDPQRWTPLSDVLLC